MIVLIFRTTYCSINLQIARVGSVFLSPRASSKVAHGLAQEGFSAGCSSVSLVLCGFPSCCLMM